MAVGLNLKDKNMSDSIAFIGGGNMASAIIGGLIRQGISPGKIIAVEPFEPAQAKLKTDFGITALESPSAALASAVLVVWAVKPQSFKEAALQTRPHTQSALHLSVAAGIHSNSMADWLATQRIVRSMPNTPALIGKGITALFARDAVAEADKKQIEHVIATTGEFLWLQTEAQLDAVTALSGSGPAYVFYFIEAMIQAGLDMGLTREQASKLAMSTFAGATELARTSTEPPEVLRQRVTSKGGTTYAAITAMEQGNVAALFISAMQAAQLRAKALGEEFGS